MRRVAAASFLGLALACGARTELFAPTEQDASVDSAAPRDASCELAPPPDASCEAAAPPPADACAPLQLHVPLSESCGLRNPQCHPVDLEGFAPFTCPISGSTCANTGPGLQEVFALNRYGLGHIAAWCDETSLGGLLTPRMLAYLGRAPSPRVASIGGYPCDQATPGKYLGKDLPASYVGDPASLAADWDVVIVCGGPVESVTSSKYSSIRIEWAPTFRAYVHDHGKGLFVVADYAANCGSPPDLFDALNAITEPAGISFSVVDLGYSDMDLDAGCVADFPP